mgnify:CR=1 FL=1
MPRITFELFKVFQVTGVGEQVEIDDRLVGLLQPIKYEVGTDKACSAGDENGHYGRSLRVTTK